MSKKSRKPPDPLFVLRTQRSEVTGLAFGSVRLGHQLYLYSGGLDGSITTWNLETRRSVGKIEAHATNAFCSHPAVQSLSPVDSGLVSQGRDGSVKLWDYSRVHRSSNEVPISSLHTDCTTFVSCHAIEFAKPMAMKNMQSSFREDSREMLEQNEAQTETEPVSLLTQQLKDSQFSTTTSTERLEKAERPIFPGNHPLIAIPTESSEQVCFHTSRAIWTNYSQDKHMGH